MIKIEFQNHLHWISSFRLRTLFRRFSQYYWCCEKHTWLKTTRSEDTLSWIPNRTGNDKVWHDYTKFLTRRRDNMCHFKDIWNCKPHGWWSANLKTISYTEKCMTRDYWTPHDTKKYHVKPKRDIREITIPATVLKGILSCTRRNVLRYLLKIRRCEANILLLSWRTHELVQKGNSFTSFDSHPHIPGESLQSHKKNYMVILNTHASSYE